MTPAATRTPRIGLYPGTFDPITLGHLDVITRATKLVDELIVAVASNDRKGPLFSVEERVAMVEADLAFAQDRLRCKTRVVAFDTLLMNFAIESKATMIIRGLRAVSDFEYEFQMTGMNTRLNPEIETVFLMAQDKYQFIASRFVKEIAKLDGKISHFVTPNVEKRLLAKIAKADFQARA